MQSFTQYSLQSRPVRKQMRSTVDLQSKFQNHVMTYLLWMSLNKPAESLH